MIKISADQIDKKLVSNNTLPYTMLIGADPYLQQYAQAKVQQGLKQVGFVEQTRFTIDNQTDWSLIFQSCQSMSLFSSRTLLILQFSSNSINAAITSKLNELALLLSSDDIALIIAIEKITKAQENSPWYKALAEKLLIVNCATPELNQLPQWLKSQLQQQEIAIEPQAIELLCYYYEGNLLALVQLLEQLKLLYPQTHAQGMITYAQIEDNINDSAVFTPYHWIDAMLVGKIKRAMHILQQLKLNDTEPLILLRTIQRELLLVINLKKMAQKTSIKQAYDEYRIWQNRRALLSPYINRSDSKKLYNVLAKLTEMEIALKHDYQARIWDDMTSLTTLFIGLNDV